MVQDSKLAKMLNSTMRELINQLDQIEESEGLANRKPGSVFRNPAGDEIIFNDVSFYPEAGGKYEPNELEVALKKINKLHPNIGWENTRSSKTGGFGIASFTSSDGMPIYVGRYFNLVKPGKRGNYMPNKVGDYNFSGKAAAKAQSGLSPQDLLTSRSNLTPKAILKQLAASLGTTNPLYKVAVHVASGKGFPIKFTPPENSSFTGFRDYFCEILQPIALMSGMYSGNAGEAAAKFLDNDFSDTLISFDDSKTAGLSDSIMAQPNGKMVKVSTKGGKGAQASAKNLIDGISDLQLSDDGRKLLKNHKETIELVQQIQQAGQHNSPLMLGVQFGIITDKEANKVRDLRTAPLINMKNIDSLGLSPKLKKIAKSRETDNPNSVNMYYHLLAAIAHDAAKKVNEDTNFSKAASDILNNGALIQVYTKAKESKKEWVLEDFETVYPSKSIKGVYLSASKTYYSTGIKGNFTFKIDKGDDKAKGKEENKDPEVIIPTKTVDLGRASRAIINKKILKSPSKAIVNPDVGRAKRQK